MMYTIARSEVVDFLEDCIRTEGERASLFSTLLKLFRDPPDLKFLWFNLCESGYRRVASLTFIKNELEMKPDLERLGFPDLDYEGLYHVRRLVERYDRRVRGGAITLDDAFKMAWTVKTCGLDELYGEVRKILGPVTGEAQRLSAIRPDRRDWVDLAKAIVTYSEDEALLERVRRLV